MRRAMRNESLEVGDEAQERKHRALHGKEGEGGNGRVDSPACTWQSKEAINHEDNAEPPLSEPRSLGWRALLVADEAAREQRKRDRARKGPKEDPKNKQEEYERQRREGPRKK